MECNVAVTTADVNRVLLDTTVEQPVETDFTLPDYCPDVGRILRCRAEPHVMSRAIASGILTAEGETKLSVIYVDGRDKHLRCCEHVLPFSVRIPVSGCPENAFAAIETCVEYVNCRAVTQRRVDVRGAFTMHVCVSACSPCEIITGAQGAGVKVRSEAAQISTCCGRNQSPFTISEALELGDGKPPIATLLRAEVSICTTECKPITNKVIIKGDAKLRMIYSTEPDGKTESMEYLLPFSQFADLNGAEDDSDISCSISVSALEITLRTDPDGEYRRLSADIRALADVCAYRTEEISAVTDAYSVDCELEIERRCSDFEKFCGMYTCTAAAEASLDASGEIASAADVWCEVCSASGEIRSGRAFISGKAQFCAIIQDADGNYEYIEKNVPFDCEFVPAGEMKNGSVRVRACVGSCGYTLSNAAKVGAKAEICISAAAYETVQLACIGAIRPDETKIKDHANDPAVVIYFAHAGEQLWDIARSHNACVDTVCEENGLSDGELAEDRMIMISIK